MLSAGVQNGRSTPFAIRIPAASPPVRATETNPCPPKPDCGAGPRQWSGQENAIDAWHHLSYAAATGAAYAALTECAEHRWRPSPPACARRATLDCRCVRACTGGAGVGADP